MEEKKWYFSKTFIGAIMIAISMALQPQGVTVDPTEVTDHLTQLIDIIDKLCAIVGPILTAVGLRTAKTTISKSLI